MMHINLFLRLRILTITSSQHRSCVCWGFWINSGALTDKTVGFNHSVSWWLQKRIIKLHVFSSLKIFRIYFWHLTSLPPESTENFQNILLNLRTFSLIQNYCVSLCIFLSKLGEEILYRNFFTKISRLSRLALYTVREHSITKILLLNQQQGSEGKSAFWQA